MVDRTGQQFGAYHLIRSLGRSDAADVYLAERLFLRAQVAIKIFTRQFTGPDEEAFRKEVTRLAHLTHPSLLRVVDGGVQNDLPFLAMDYAPGGSLRQRHPRGTVLHTSLVLAYLTPIVAALHYAHDRALIHGHIKPENMLVGRAGDLLLSDVGLAALTPLLSQRHARAVAYLAPEQLQGRPQLASDQYALGVVVYEWLSGDVPFHGSFDEVAHMHLSVPPMPLREKAPAISSYVEQVVLKALAKDPHQRFDSVRMFAEELEQACQSTQPFLGESGPSAPTLLPLIPTTRLAPPAQGAPAAGTVSCTYRGHAHHVYAVAWLPGGTRIASGSRDKTVHVWEAATGHLVFSYQGHADRVYAVVWSPDGRRIASAGADGTVQVWDAANGQSLLIYHSPAPVVHGLAWSPDGRRIASDSSPMVQVWEAAGGSSAASPAGAVLTYRGHPSGVHAVAWSPTGTLIASGGSDHTMQVWDATTGAAVAIYRGHTGAVTSVGWSPNGAYLASGGDDAAVHVWGSGATAPICTCHGHRASVQGVTWSPDGTRIASASSDGTVRVWDAVTGENSFIYHGHIGKHPNRVHAVAWSPDGTHIASGGEDEAVHIWQAPPWGT